MGEGVSLVVWSAKGTEEGEGTAIVQTDSLDDLGGVKGATKVEWRV